MVAHGPHNGNAKLTPEQALDIYLLARSKRYWQRELAEAFGISQSEVSLIEHCRRWCWLLLDNEGNEMMTDKDAEFEERLAASEKRVAELEAKLGEARKPAEPMKREPYQPIDYTRGATMDRETKRDLAAAIPDDLARDLRADLARGNPIHQSVAQLTPDRPNRPGQVQIVRGTNIVDPRPDDPPHGLVKGNQWGK
jgi:hypothetical protein